MKEIKQADMKECQPLMVRQWSSDKEVREGLSEKVSCELRPKCSCREPKEEFC